MASGDTLVIGDVHLNEAPSSAAATLDVRNGRWCLDFDAATIESAYFPFVLPLFYSGGGLTLDIWWAASSATANVVVWGGAIERGNTDVDADSFASQQTANGTANATSGIYTKTSITFSSGANMDSMAAGEPGRLQIQRVANNASDTMTGDSELYHWALRET